MSSNKEAGVKKNIPPPAESAKLPAFNEIKQAVQTRSRLRREKTFDTAVSV